MKLRMATRQRSLADLLGTPIDAQTWAVWDAYPEAFRLDIAMLRLRFDAEGQVQATLQDIGNVHGVTRERVRMRLQRALKWWRKQRE